MLDRLRYLLLQVRNATDPMRGHEVKCFARALHCDESQIRVFDLLAGVPSHRELNSADMLLFGGSGDYSAAGESQWLEKTLDGFGEILSHKRPTFASCWGFQALARAAGGTVIHNLEDAELGTLELHLTEAGERDPVFGPLGVSFFAQAGHEDHVIELPPGTVLLAYSDQVRNQAYRFVDAPIYCTQFHPELHLEDLIARLRAYPRYVEQIAGVPLAEFEASCREAPETEMLLLRFVEHVFS